jgi:hypothetical protein
MPRITCVPRRAGTFAGAAASLVVALAACGSDVVPAGPGGAGGSGGSGGAGPSSSSEASTGAGDSLGEPCDEEGSLRCSDADDGTFLICRLGRYEALGACDAGEACQDVQGAHSVACGGTFLGVAGTPCVDNSTAVCDLAREVVLGCDAGSWTVSNHCAPVACANVAPAPGNLCSGMACENCGYTIGDRCRFPAGTVNCSTDGSAIVACNGGVVTLSEDCGASGLVCTFAGGVIECL